MKNIVSSFLLMFTLLLPVSCGSGNANSSASGTEVEMGYAKNLTLQEFAEGVTIAELRNPWDTTRTLQRLILVDKERDIPTGLPEGTIVRTPLERSVVYTSVHNSLIEELGAADAVVGVCDPKYIKEGIISQRVDKGMIADCGSSMSPNIEKILQLKPDAILVSSYENSNDHNKVGQLGIPVIDCPDYMELSPLGRAEWMRFFGRLYGKADRADSLFRETEKNYLAIKEKASKVKERPIVLTEMIYGQTWDVPGANSTVGVMIKDAGGKTPFEEYQQSGSVRLSPEEVLFKAKNADFWLVKYMQDTPMTLTQLGKENPVYPRFDAFANKRVYGLDTMKSTYFEDAAFHPDWILSDYVRIIHPELVTGSSEHSYYRKLDD